MSVPQGVWRVTSPPTRRSLQPVSSKQERIIRAVLAGTIPWKENTTAGLSVSRGGTSAGSGTFEDVNTAVVENESALEGEQRRLVCRRPRGLERLRFSGVIYPECRREICHALSGWRVTITNTSYCGSDVKRLMLLNECVCEVMICWSHKQDLMSSFLEAYHRN